MIDLSKFPNEILIRIAQYSDLPEIGSFAKCSKTCRQIGTDDAVWKVVAEKIGCPLQDNLPAMTQVKQFVGRVLKLAAPLDPSNELQTDKKSPTIAQIKAMKNLMGAHDVMKIWQKLGFHLNPLGNRIDIFQEETKDFNVQQLINKSYQFDAWFAANRDQFNGHTSLILDRFNLSHLPEQLYQLTGLQSLSLDNNLLSCAPLELCGLTELRYIDLRNNPLTQFPSHLFGLPKLTTLLLPCRTLKPDADPPLTIPPGLILSKGFFEGLPDEVNYQIGAALGYSVECMRSKRLSTYNLLQVEIENNHSITGRNRVNLTFEEYRQLIRRRRAHETLMIWKQLNRQLNQGASSKDTFGVEKDHFETTGDFLEIAAKFKDWIARHETELASLTNIDFLEYEPPIELFTPSLIGRLLCKGGLTWQKETYERIASYVGSNSSDCFDITLFTWRLLVSASRGKDLPPDISSITKLSKPTCEQVRKHYNFVKERDTLVIWQRLCKHLEIDPETISAKAPSEFSAWVKEHKTRLAQLVSLDLADLNLFFLPEELGQLTSLKCLNLSCNTFLITIPRHMRDLPLVELDLSDTVFIDLDVIISKLSRLEKLKIPRYKSQVGQIDDNLLKHNFIYNAKSGFYEKRQEENE